MKNWLTEEQKEALKNPRQEHILLVNEAGAYELVPYKQIECKCEDIRAFSFSRENKNYVVFWHKTGKGQLRLPFIGAYTLERELGKADVSADRREKEIILPAAERLFFSSTEPMELLTAAFENAIIAK